MKLFDRNVSLLRTNGLPNSPEPDISTYRSSRCGVCFMSHHRRGGITVYQFFHHSRDERLPP
jgi:hypothetical protein